MTETANEAPPKVDTALVLDTLAGINQAITRPGSLTSERRGVLGVQAVTLAVAVLNRVFGLELAFTEDHAIMIIGALESFYGTWRVFSKASENKVKVAAMNAIAATAEKGG